MTAFTQTILRRRLLLIAAYILSGWLLTTTTATAATWIHDPNGTTIQPFTHWADTYHTPLPDADITVYVDWTNSHEYCGPNPEIVACAWPTGPHSATIAMQHWTGDSHKRFGARATFAHELGHVFDFTMMNAQSRHTFALLRGHPSRPWNDEPNATIDTALSNGPLREQFAEAYRTCAIYGMKPGLVGIYGELWGYTPSPHSAARICKLIHRVGVGD